MLSMTWWLVREASLLEDDFTSVHWMGRLAMKCYAIHYSWGFQESVWAESTPRHVRTRKVLRVKFPEQGNFIMMGGHVR